MATANFLMTGARVLYAPTGTSLPSETNVAWGAAWSGFTELGELGEELRVNLRQTETGISPQNALSDTKGYITNEALSAESSLLDFTGPNLALLMHATNTTTGAGGSQKPYDKVKGGGDPVIVTKLWGFEGFRPDSNGTKQPLRFFIYIGSIRMNGPIKMGKEARLMKPFFIKAYADTTKSVGSQLYEWHIVTGPTS